MPILASHCKFDIVGSISGISHLVLGTTGFKWAKKKKTTNPIFNKNILKMSLVREIPLKWLVIYTTIKGVSPI